MAQIYVLTKLFDQSEYREDFRKGFLFMRKLKEFSAMEEDTPEKRGDKDEGISVHYQPGQHKVMLNGVETEGLAGPTTIKTGKAIESFAFCMYAVNSGDYTTFTDSDVPAFKNSLKINADAAALGNEMLVILNCEEFIRRMTKAFASKNIYHRYDLVKYFDPATFHCKIEDKEVGFWKRNIYQKQNEYRIIADIPSTDGTVKFTIGDLSDITMATTPEEFNEKLEIRLEKIITQPKYDQAFQL
jgi:hypothetical protein